jgi:23S rRNA-/tRNA-specific pseudouridylate synthase
VNRDVTPIVVVDSTPHELVVCKPPGLASELPRDPSADSLLTRLSAQGFSDLRLVHRLDSPACGLMVVARTVEAAAHYSAEIAARRWQKLYAAEVSVPVSHARTLVGKHKAYLSTEGRRAVVVRSGGKPSFLTIVDASDAPGSPTHSHMLVHLHTGRFHQIRVMLAELGAPLVGDPLYAGSARAPGHPAFRAAGPPIIYLEHVMLAARRFGQTHPTLWRAPNHDGRPKWSDDFTQSVDAHATSLLSEA